MSDVFTDLDDPGWSALFENIERSWFRLETLQVYAVAYEDLGQAQFLSSGVVDDAPTSWREMIRAHTDHGRRLQRVHVVEEPLTDYLRYEMAMYDLNHQAGEEISIIPVSSGEWPPGLPKHTDFWLFDDQDLWAMHYDHAGRFLAAARETSTERLDECRRWQAIALSQAVPLGDYALAR